MLPTIHNLNTPFTFAGEAGLRVLIRGFEDFGWLPTPYPRGVLARLSLPRLSEVVRGRTGGAAGRLEVGRGGGRGVAGQRGHQSTALAALMQ